jgi:deazaflavin-dependent oxidoreductase (nitroreductase family)
VGAVGESGAYRRPGWVARKVVNRVVAAATRAGISVSGSRVLEVRGRSSGEPRRVPLVVLSFGGDRYLIAARGETQWARNLRTAGEGVLLLGRRREHFRATELEVQERGPILRAYLRAWEWEVGRFFGGVGPDAEPDELRRVAADHPVFRIEP